MRESLQLCSASVRCLGRRARATAGHNPRIVVLAIALALAAPIGASRLASEVAPKLGGLLDDPAAASAFVGALALTAAVAGGAASLTVPGVEAFGGQLRAAPLSAPIALCAVAFAPFVLAVAAASVVLAASFGSIVSSSPGGRPALVTLGITLLAMTLSGACMMEAARSRLLRVRILAGALGVLACWLLVSGSAGSLSPLEPAIGHITGSSPAVSTGVVLLVLEAITASALWPVLVAGRARRSARFARMTWLGQPETPVTATFVAASRLLARRGDLRLARIATTGFGVSGVALSITGAVSPAPALLLSGIAATMCAAALPLAVGGAVLDGFRLWAVAPASVERLAAGWIAASLGLFALPVVAVVLAPTLLYGELAVAGQLGAASAAICACALAAGVLVPWRAGATDQIASFGSFTLVVCAVGSTTGLVAGRLEQLRVPGVVISSCMVGLVLVVTLLGLARRMAPVGSEARGR